MRLGAVLNLGKLLGVAGLGVGTSLAGAALFHRLLAGLAVVLLLAIVSSVIVGALAVAGLYAFYLLLVHYGTLPHVALGLACAAALLITALLAGTAFFRLKKLKDIPQQILHTEAPVASRVSDIAESFFDGLMERPRTRRHF